MTLVSYIYYIFFSFFFFYFYTPSIIQSYFYFMVALYPT